MSKIVVNGTTYTFCALYEGALMADSVEKNPGVENKEWKIIKALLDYIAANPAPAALRDAFVAGSKFFVIYSFSTNAELSPKTLVDMQAEAAALYPDLAHGEDVVKAQRPTPTREHVRNVLGYWVTNGEQYAEEATDAIMELLGGSHEFCPHCSAKWKSWNNDTQVNMCSHCGKRRDEGGAQ